MEEHLPERLNEDIAGRLEEVAQLLATQGASRFRVRAYQRAAGTVRRLMRPVSDIFAQEGLEGLQALPGVGESIARAIRDMLARGRLAMLERLRGESDPAKLLASVPGIGRTTADRLGWPYTYYDGARDLRLVSRSHLHVHVSRVGLERGADRLVEFLWSRYFLRLSIRALPFILLQRPWPYKRRSQGRPRIPRPVGACPTAVSLGWE